MVEIRMNNLFKVIITLVFLSGLSQADVPVQEHTLIEPGLGVGVLRLDDSLEVVNRKIGEKKADDLLKVEVVNRKIGEKKADDSLKVQDEKKIEMWLPYKDMGLTLVYDYDTQRLKEIIVTSRGLLVEGTGIRVGSSTSDLSVYDDEKKDTTIIDKEQNRVSWDYPELGVSFCIDNDDQKIYAIKVYPREARKKINR